MADYYELLGVSRSASDDELKKAYRKRARELHPDANPDDADSEAKFKELSKAYEVLKDPQKRQRYDAYGEAGVSGNGGGGGDPFGFGGGISDIFDAFFGGSGGAGFGGGGRSGPPRGPDLEVVAEIDFVEAVFGVNKSVEVRTALPCDTCEATGAKPGTSAQTCGECRGAGQVRRVRQSMLGQMVTTASCPSCNGAGEIVASPCEDCGGEGRTLQDKAYTVDIPAGVDTGSTLRLTGRGAAGPRGGGSGDLYVHVRVADHPVFRREGADIHAELHIAVTQAILGTSIEFETLDGVEHIEISPGTNTGKVLRLRNRGAPIVNRGGRGDMRLTVVVDLPDRLDAEQEQLIRSLARMRGESVADSQGFFSKLRGAFK